MINNKSSPDKKFCFSYFALLLLLSSFLASGVEPMNIPMEWNSLGFIKQPKTAGTSFSNWILQHLARKLNLPPLRSSLNCTQHADQTNAFCARPFCIPGMDPYMRSPAPRIIMDHAYFDEDQLESTLVKPVLYFSLFRDPLQILRSMYNMAYFQWKSKKKDWVKAGDDSFCQSLTSDENSAEEWIRKCPAAVNSSGLILDYFTGFNRSKNARQVLEKDNFLPLLYDKFDESLVLFAKVTGLPYTDLLYVPELKYYTPTQIKAGRVKSDVNWVRDSVQLGLHANPYLKEEISLFEVARMKFHQISSQIFVNASELDAEVQKFTQLKKSFQACIHHKIGIYDYHHYVSAVLKRKLPPLVGGDCGYVVPTLTMAVHLKQICGKGLEAN